MGWNKTYRSLRGRCGNDDGQATWAETREEISLLHHMTDRSIEYLWELMNVVETLISFWDRTESNEHTLGTET